MTVEASNSSFDQQEIQDLFEDQLRLALNHYQDPEWLGEQSPLSSPYFLGDALASLPPENAETAVGRGELLQTLLFEAAATRLNGSPPPDRDDFLELVNTERMAIGNKGAAYQLLLLDLKYFRRIFPSRSFPQAKREVDIREFLGVGRGPYFNHLKQARQALAENLLRRLQPTLRLEQPPHPQGTLLGQAAYHDATLAHLQQNQTVFINGSGGCGKTTLGATLARSWPTPSVFWYTFWPSLNDQLDSLLFALGHFLNQQGASNLWRQLVANSGHLDNPNIALAHLRTDLADLAERPLLCFDEIDYLLRDPEMRSADANELLTFLERLQGLAPILFIGQQSGLRADHYLTLSGLSAVETATLIAQAELDLSASAQSRLHQLTGGNPRLLKLCLALLKEQRIALEDLPQAPSIAALFASLWRNMPSQEQALAQQLAVFRSPAPADAWEAYQNGLQLLTNHALLQSDSQGGVRLLPIFSELIRSDSSKLSADDYERCHLEAAAVRAERGEYTAAMYHLIQAGEPEQAVQLWTIYREQEVARGQASIAYAQLQHIPRRRLSAEGQQALALAIGELSDLLGKPEAGLEAIDKVSWPRTAERTVDAQTLRGKFLNALGERDEALETFDASLQRIGRLLLKQVHLYNWRGVIHVQQRNLKSALESARRAQYEAELFYGLVQEQQGGMDEAFLAYQRALALASTIPFAEGIAKANRGLASLLVRQGRQEEALTHAQTAVEHFDSIGDSFNREKARNIIIAIYFNQQRFDKVITLGESSLRFFNTSKIPYWASVTAATLAEAYLENGDIDQAERRARQVLELEEPQSMPYAHYTLGLVAKTRNNPNLAHSHLTYALKFAEQTEDLYLEAYAARVLGEICVAQDAAADAGQHFKRALAGFQKLGNVAEAQQTESLLMGLDGSKDTS